MSSLDFYCCDEHRDPKQHREERTCLVYVCWLQTIIEGNSVGTQAGQASETRTETQSMEKCCSWLAPPGLLRLAFWYTLGHQPRADALLSALWDLHINHQSRKWPTSLPAGPSDKGLCPVEVLPPQMTTACVEFTPKQTHGVKSTLQKPQTNEW